MRAVNPNEDMPFTLLYLFAALLLFSCSNSNEKTDASSSQDSSTAAIDSAKSEETMHDPHSYARPDLCAVHHLDLTLNINFNDRTLQGVAHWRITDERKSQEIIFDTKHLNIEKVELDNGDEAQYELGPENDIFGAPLIVQLSPETKSVAIHYSTNPGAEALMWLSPEQTAGKEHPFLFTQSQAILARTWIPCQDGPGVRYTYTADVQGPKNLLTCMSASNPQEKNATGLYHFEMKQRVPSYLMALVCGDLTFRSISKRTGVYAEPSIADDAEWELELMDEMLVKAEGLYGNYRWDRYDVVFLPPSFPFGGMENPRLTFATPTIIAGDRSLTALIAHELAHSWSGNLVTNATWNDFWLNEGFTVYFEQRIMEEVYGREYSEMLALNSYNGLLEEIEEFKAEEKMEATHLKLSLGKTNPDDGLTAIAYDKGYLFLRMLEETYGRQVFDDFLKQYFQEHAFGVMTTEEFVEYLDAHLLSTDEKLKKQANIDAWIYGPGLPDNCPEITSKKLDKVDLAVAFTEEMLKQELPLKKLDTTGWTAHEYIYYVDQLPKDLTAQHLALIDDYFHFSQSSNSEILGKWYPLAATARYQTAYGPMKNFLLKVGRRKFLTPIYKALMTTEEGAEQAKSIYEEARPNYHAVARNTLDEVVDWTETETTKT